MLKYLVQLTGDLMSAGLIIGMLFAYIRFNFKKRGTVILLCAGGLSLIIAVAKAIVMNTSNSISAKLNIGYVAYMNMAAFLIFAATALIFILFSFDFIRIHTKVIGEYAVYLSASVLILTLAFYCLPTVLAYPLNFDVADNSVFSTDFIYRFIGCILGFVLVLIASIAVYKAEKALKSPLNKLFLDLAILINASKFIGQVIQLMLSRRMIHQTHTLFTIVKITNNYSEYFIFAIMICALVAAAYLFLKNIKVTEEYANPAQHRKIRARMRNQRRWSVALLICVLVAGINLTVVDAYNNKEPDEAPVEEGELVGDEVIVPLSMVEDGHLHRFGYETESGILVKFIVVKKPGSTTYGVGLDACDICGDAGYYEKNDQIVCRRCDVVMNTNTIGFKGGCNPIVIDYRVEDGNIIVPVATLVDHQDEFK